MNDLDKRATTGLVWLFLAMAALIFISAGTVHFWQAWIYLAVFFIGCLATTFSLMRTDRALLERRMAAGPTAEKQPTQKIIMLLAMLGFVALAVVPALDHRFGWSHVPTAIVLIGDLAVAIGFLIIHFVYRENSFASATIEIARDHKVITMGPYAIIRHPMYAGGLILLAASPLALGSWWGLLVFIPLLPILMWRLLDEEKFLAKNLPGYTAYQTQVIARLMPFIW